VQDRRMVLLGRGWEMAGIQFERGEMEVRPIEVGCHCWLSRLSQVPHPLGEDLPDLLTVCRVRTPSITVLLTIFRSRARSVTAATMQRELGDIGSSEAESRQCCAKEFRDDSVADHANRTGGGLMRRNNQSSALSFGGDRHLPTIKQISTSATFRMGELLIGG
jgi:hypothetical protein